MHFRRSRRLIPASAYYEWQDTAVGKQPWYFTPAGGEPITFAGYVMSGKTRRLARSCTMIITEPNDFVAEVHDRNARNPCAQQLCKRRPSKSHLPVRILHAQPTNSVSVAHLSEPSPKPYP
jgi:hypothetical protein